MISEKFKNHILKSMRSTANLDDALSRVAEMDIEHTECEYLCYISVDTVYKRRKEWLKTNNLSMSKEEKKLWNEIYDSIAEES